jgi:hypothetical protein
MTNTQLQAEIDQQICREILIRRRAVQHLQADFELVEGDEVQVQVEGQLRAAKVDQRHLRAIAAYDQGYPYQFDPACPITFRVEPLIVE